MKTNRINTFFEQRIDLNQRREERIRRRYDELKAFANDTDYIKYGEAQGSFPTETYLKPLKEEDLYDLDFVFLIKENLNPESHNKIISYREKIQEDIEGYAKEQQWEDHKINEMKYGFEIVFKNDLKIDIVTSFSDGENTFIINYLDNMKPKFDEPILLTELLVRSNDETKTTLVKIIKFLKRASFADTKGLDVLPSIAISILTMNETKNYPFSWANIAKLANDIIKTKNSKLFNPFNQTEEFFGINGDWATNAKKFLIALDSIRLTIEKAVKEDNDQQIVEMLSEGVVTLSNGIDEKPSGAGGHA